MALALVSAEPGFMAVSQGTGECDFRHTLNFLIVGHTQII